MDIGQPLGHNEFLDFSELKIILLRAINYPDYARPEYFIIHQRLSQWSKGVFLRALWDIYSFFQVKLELQINKEKGKMHKESQNFDRDAVSLDLEKETNGQIKGNLTKKLLEELRFAIERAYKLDEPVNLFSTYDILAFCERILLFIKDEFINQIEKTGKAELVAEESKRKGNNIIYKPEYLLHYYNIITEAPILDFNKYRNVVRDLLLNSRNPDELKVMLKPVFNKCVEIINIWNEKLQPIAEPYGKNSDHKGKGIYDGKVMSFDHASLQIWRSTANFDEQYLKEPSKFYHNRDFALFASRVANLISREVLKNDNEAVVSVNLKELSDFDELFINPDLASGFYEILKEAELIDDNYKYKKGLKSAFCVWVRELERGSTPVINCRSDKVYTNLLNKKFAGLNLDSSNFRTGMKRAREKHEIDFRNAVSQLSQVSQNRR